MDSEGPAAGEATRLLRAAAGGAPAESDALLRLLYDELHRLADRQMSGERAGHTLQPTALLHEAWVKLFEGEADPFEDRRHFLATAACAMRQILVDLVELDAALAELRRLAPRHAQVVECRFFAELSVPETAEALGISERTVAREWRFARAWLANALEDARTEARRDLPAEGPGAHEGS